MSSPSNGYIYLDNNGTTKASPGCKKAVLDWIRCQSNPSGSTFIGQASKNLIDKTEEWIRKEFDLKGYKILFTSGASESNCSFIKSITDSWLKAFPNQIPHIISSSIEHKSIIECLNQLVSLKRAEVTFVDPNKYGIIDPQSIEAELKPNTALVTVIYANNETGSLNPVSKIAQITHAKNIPFHTDAVQIFGKIPLQIKKLGIDALSMSFHKLYGPMGLGLLIIKDDLIKGYKLESQICGSQQNGLRGGTEPVPLIAGAAAALVDNFKDRKAKNLKVLKLRELLISLLKKDFNVIGYADYLQEKKHNKPNLETTTPKKFDKCIKQIVIIGPPQEHKQLYLPSTILMSIVDHGKRICNVKLKKLLESKNVIVSIGSACNTASPKASHVLTALGAPPEIKQGVLRVSLGDYNTVEDVKKFIQIFKDCLLNCDIYLPNP